MNESQSIKETLYLHLLKDLDASWPKGKLIKSESPDFILRTGRKRSIGIEMTDLTLPDTAHTENMKRIGERVQQRLGEHIFLQVFFHSEKVVLDTLSESGITHMITERVVDLNKNPEKVNIITDGLPDGLSMICISFLPGSNRSIFESKLSMDVRRIDPDLLMSSIHQKEEKLGLYNKRWTDQLWLVLTVNGMLTPASYNLQEKIGQWKIPSLFDRTILLDVAGKRSMEIAD